MGFEVNLLNAAFVLLLCLVAMVRLIWPGRHQLLLILLAGAVAVGIGSPKTLLVISGTTLLFIYPLQRVMKVARDRSWNPLISRALFPCGVSVLVGALVFFKLNNEFTLAALAGRWLRAEALALVGFSYFILR